MPLVELQFNVFYKELSMKEYIIMTDSSCDLPLELLNNLEISVLPLSLVIDDKKYYNYPDQRDITFSEFYALMRNKKISKTSAVNSSDFLNEMEKFLKQGKDILYLGFSSELSCTYNNAITATEQLLKIYPDRKIYTIDTLCASLGQGLLVYLAAMEKQKGKSIEELRDFVENIKLKICHWFTVEDLHHLKRGGRISSSTAVIGSVLGIKPILHVDNMGKLVNVGKVRGRKASINELFNKIKENAIIPSKQTVFISHGDCLDDANYLASLLKEKLGVKEVIINYIGPVIGTHSGPGTMAMFFLGNER